MVHLVRITEFDYRDYRRSYAKIEYSFRTKDQPPFVIPDDSKKFMDATILKKGEFLDELERKGVEMYFIKNNAEEIVGITTFQTDKKEAYIGMFAVFEKCKGIGTESFNQVKELLKTKGIKEVWLDCPFDGACVFWEKQGFQFQMGTFCKYKARL